MKKSPAKNPLLPDIFGTVTASVLMLQFGCNRDYRAQEAMQNVEQRMESC